MDKPTVMIYRAEGQGKDEATGPELFLRIPRQSGYLGSPVNGYTQPDQPDADTVASRSSQIFFNPAKNTRYFA
jgi:hypothetical protein